MFHLSLADGIFSIVTSCLNQEANLQTPADVRRTDTCWFPCCEESTAVETWVFFKYCTWALKQELHPTCLNLNHPQSPTRTLLQRMAPLFAKSGMRFECEMVDTVTWFIKQSQLIAAAKTSLDSKNMALWNHILGMAKIRDWCRMMPAGSTLRNAYRARKGDRDNQDDPMKVPQSFSFIAREGWVLEVIIDQPNQKALFTVNCNHYCS